MNQSEKLRALPPVNDVLAKLETATGNYPRPLVVAEVRRALDRARQEVSAGRHSGPIDEQVLAVLTQLSRPSLGRVINATGVVLHTNLGRAPLGPAAVGSGYSNLEYDLASGRRGRRDAHLDPLLERILGAPGIAVNNNAAAVFLALNELAAGYEVVVSRGELIEIGDGFRIPDIMTRSGAVLKEIGTTNRTRLEDYRAAITERTRLLLRVHPSNFHISGFTGRPELADLAALGREHGIPLYEDLGSGCLADLRPFGIDEPLVPASLRAGVSLVSFSGDKLLGGPQAGILAGNPELVARLRRNPLFRALRLDKVIIQLLEQTLRRSLLEQWDEIPALAMIRLPAERIRERAERLLASLRGLDADVAPGHSVIGGGATPQQSLPTWVIRLSLADAPAAERQLRAARPPVIARIENDRLLLDLRTVREDEEAELAGALQALSR